MTRTGLREFAEERRRLPMSIAEVTIRALRDDSDTTTGDRFHGLAAMFNKRTAIGNPQTFGFYEEIAPGCFTKALQESDTRFLVDHNPYYVVARVSAGSLELAQNKVGLPVGATLDPALSYVNDLKANVRNGNITGMSFGFQVVKDEWNTERVTTRDGSTADVEVRRLIEVTLPEVSAVAFPAYEDTQAELASIALALTCRGDTDAIERRAAHRPELLDMCEALRGPRRARGSGTEPRKAMSAHTTATMTGPWSAVDHVGNIPSDAPASTLAGVYAWKNPDGDPDAKSSYSMPHHVVDSDGRLGAASTVACSAGIAALNGARDGTSIPAGERQGVWNHLAAHMKDAKLDPPPLKSANSASLDIEARDDDEPDSPPVEEETAEGRSVESTGSVVIPDLDEDDDTENGQKKKKKTPKKSDGDNGDMGEKTEPAEPTRTLAPTLTDRMRTLGKRYRLPVREPLTSSTH